MRDAELLGKVEEIVERDSAVTVSVRTEDLRVLLGLARTGAALAGFSFKRGEIGGEVRVACPSGNMMVVQHAGRLEQRILHEIAEAVAVG